MFIYILINKINNKKIFFYICSKFYTLNKYNYYCYQIKYFTYLFECVETLILDILKYHTFVEQFLLHLLLVD